MKFNHYNDITEKMGLDNYNTIRSTYIDSYTKFAIVLGRLDNNINTTIISVFDGSICLVRSNGFNSCYGYIDITIQSQYGIHDGILYEIRSASGIFKYKNLRKFIINGITCIGFIIENFEGTASADRLICNSRMYYNRVGYAAEKTTYPEVYKYWSNGEVIDQAFIDSITPINAKTSYPNLTNLVSTVFTDEYDFRYAVQSDSTNFNPDNKFDFDLWYNYDYSKGFAKINWEFASSNSIINNPLGSSSAGVAMLISKGYPTQIVWSYGNYDFDENRPIYIRRWYNTWSHWSKIIGTPII